MKRRVLFSVTGLLLASTFAYAQGVGSGAGGVVGSGMMVGITGGVSNGLQGAPFSADVITESTNALADGTQIHQETHGRMFRDSQGRTRNENEIIPPLPAAAVQHVIIHDPVQNTMIMLNPNTKTATITHMHEIPRPGNMAATRPVPPLQQQRMSAKREDLGTMDIEGLPATGTRLTRTIPVGAIGNDRPIVSVTETWMSTDLKIVVLSTTDDPRSGKRTMKLINIQRSEPDPSLFQVPPDYTVTDRTSPQ